MKNISTGEVYEYKGVYHLVLLESYSISKQKKFWCALDWTQNINNLIYAYNCFLLNPNKEWRYIETVTNEQYEKAVANFRNRQEKRIYGCEIKKQQGQGGLALTKKRRPLKK